MLCECTGNCHVSMNRQAVAVAHEDGHRPGDVGVRVERRVGAERPDSLHFREIRSE